MRHAQQAPSLGERAPAQARNLTTFGDLAAFEGVLFRLPAFGFFVFASQGGFRRLPFPFALFLSFDRRAFFSGFLRRSFFLFVPPLFDGFPRSGFRPFRRPLWDFGRVGRSSRRCKPDARKGCECRDKQAHEQI
jgi:hypothetical protein